jgi:hypothetical protein
MKPELSRVVTPVPPLLVAAAPHVTVTAWLVAPVHGNAAVGPVHEDGVHDNCPGMPSVK